MHFNRFPLTKICDFWAKKYRGVMFDDTEYWCKIWTKTDLCFQKWHEEFQKFLLERSKDSNSDFDVSLLSKAENVWSWNLQGSYVSWRWWMRQNWKRNWLAVSKLTLEVWRILTQALKSLKNLHFNGLFLIELYNVLVKKDRRVMLEGTEDFPSKFEGKGTCAFKNEMKNLANFRSQAEKQLFHFRK